MLLFATYLYEETKDFKDLIEEWYDRVDEFHDTYWRENKRTDFIEVPAQIFDHPTPSSVSMAEMALLRAAIILGKEYTSKKYKHALAHDFFNLMVSIGRGNLSI